MLLSSCVVWRHREWDAFRRECPGGDGRLQRLVWERLDDALTWLDALGAPIVWRDTENPRTTGRRYEPRGLTDVLVRAAGEPRLRTTVRDLERPLVLATGGYPVLLARDRGLLVRSNPWSEGDGIELARRHGAALAGDLDEFYGRALPAPPARVGEADFVRLAQLYGERARLVDDAGLPLLDGPPAWHENDVALAIARRPSRTAWLVVDDPSHPRLAATREAGGEVVDEDGRVRVRVTVGVTHTLGGLRVDDAARVVDANGSPIDGLYAAGVDVGGIANGGYASGLAQALVLGLVAAESVLGAL